MSEFVYPRDSDGFALCHHGRRIMCEECVTEEQAAAAPRPGPSAGERILALPRAVVKGGMLSVQSTWVEQDRDQLVRLDDVLKVLADPPVAAPRFDKQTELLLVQIEHFLCGLRDDPQHPSRPLWERVCDHLDGRAAPPETPRERVPSAWAEFGDWHDYSRTGKHSPGQCRYCLREHIAKLTAAAPPPRPEEPT